MSMVEISGEVVADHAVAEEFEEYRSLTTPCVLWGATAQHGQARLFSFRAREVVVTSGYLSIHVPSRRLFGDQSYSNLAQWFRLRPTVEGDRFSIVASCRRLSEPHVIIGGPIDGVWYHWMVNWCPRLLLLRKLRPDLFEDPSVRFLIDDRAAQEPYRAVLESMGIDMARVTFADHAVDYLLDDAILVSFLDQRRIYPDLVRALARKVKAHFAVKSGGGTERIFVSRQGFDFPKRRIANFDPIQPVLEAYGFRSVLLGEMSARAQVELFAKAECVIGAHGSDFTDIVFASPGAKMIVFENARNVAAGLAGSLQALAEVARADYHCMVVDEEVRDDVDYSRFENVHNRDLIVPPAALRAELDRLGVTPLRR